MTNDAGDRLQALCLELVTYITHAQDEDTYEYVLGRVSEEFGAGNRAMVVALIAVMGSMAAGLADAYADSIGVSTDKVLQEVALQLYKGQ